MTAGPDGSSLLRRLDRERRARLESEKIAESATSQLYATIQELKASEAVRRQTEEEILLLQSVSLAAATAPDLDAALAISLRRVCEATGWECGQAWMPSADSSYLELAPAWYTALPDAAGPFRAASVRLRIRRGEGLPGRAWRSGQPVWIRDIASDTEFPRAQYAEQVGFTSAMAVPILADDTFVGVIEFFVSQPRDEDERLLNVVSSVARELGTVFERKAAEQALRDSEERYRTTLQTASDAFISIDSTGRVIEWNRRAETMFGWSADEAKGMSLTDTIIPPKYRAAHARGMQTFLATLEGKVLYERLELTALSRDGREFPIELTIWPTRERGHWRFNAFVEDTTERTEVKDALVYQALHDALTGLPNRSLLRDRLDQALARSSRRNSRTGIMFLDLDRFKVVNDSLGHAAGDELLVEVAQRLLRAVRPSDTVARFGGDEFVVLCEELVSDWEATVIGERIASAFAAPFNVQGTELFVTTSVGIALADPGEAADSVLRDADAAMYLAKERGRARAEVFDDTLRGRASSRLQTESGLRRAIDNDELLVLYQPIVALDGGGIVGAEALLRWQHPERGLIAPSEFIPIAEETGLIVPIGNWVLRQALVQAQIWRSKEPEHRHFSIAVNLSARQLLVPSLIDEVSQSLTESGIDPGAVRLEITESVLMEDVEFSIESLQGLRFLGVRLAIDDFGTGYSSLSYLKRFPLDVLKVDQIFVDGLGTDDHDTSLVSAIVGLGRALGLAVVAEGVENEVQLAGLQALHCPFAQGYYFARPLPEEEMSALLATTVSLPTKD